jgi:hypothetical protein
LFLLLLLGASGLAQDDRETVLKQESPKLKSEYRTAPLKPRAKESPLSGAYYTLLNRYVRFAETNMKDWPAEPGARFHKRDGSLEHSVRQNASVALGFAVLAKFGPYDEGLARAPRAKVLADAVALVRYLTVTHKANFLPAGDGKKWGDHWQSAYWTAIVGETAWLVWQDLPDETKVMAARMVIHEADRFNQRPPDDGMKADTKAEENAWNSEIVALAHCMFPEHPRARLWGERAKVYMMNAFSTAADRTDSRLVDGKPIKEWVTTTCVSPDYTVENHNRIHPDYLSCSTLSLHNAAVYRLAGLEVPEATFHHAKECLEVLEWITATNGTLFYINGQDWWPHQPAIMMLTAGLFNALRPDATAAFVERAGLATQQKMHSRFDDGRAFDPREANYANPEEDMMFNYADLYLAHCLFGEGAAPISAGDFQRACSGARIFDAAGFVTHRTAEKFVSFCWVNNVMGLVFPSEDTWFTPPYERGLLGSILVDRTKDTPAKLEARNVTKLRLPGHLQDEGFAFVGKFSRCEAKIEQRIAVISLPTTPVVYIERLSAREDVNVKEIATATVAIFNEEAAPLSNERRVWTAEGEQLMRGADKAPSKVHVWKTGWANLEDKLGVVAQASGRMSYLENHRYERARLQQVLAANYLGNLGPGKAGQVLSEAAVALFPNASHGQQMKLQMDRVGKDGFAVRLGQWRIVANLGDGSLTGEVAGRDRQLEALNAVVEVATANQ